MRKMDSNRIIISLLSIILLVIQGTQTSPAYQQAENYSEGDKYLPGFLTLGQKYSIALGSTVILPCKINETEKSSDIVLAWIRNRAVMVAGPTKVTTNTRVRLMPSTGYTSGYNLEIKDVRLTDAGEYICQMGGEEVPKEVIHTLEVLIPPKIDYVSHNRLDVQKGSPVRIECRAIGNPKPKIIWTRKNNMMPNGEANITGNVLELQHATRHTAGHYRCIADNRVGQTDAREINVIVMYPPEIEVERSLIHTGVGYEAQLICIVHAEPQPHVIWYKDTTQLGTTEQHSQQNRGNKYSLIIRNVTYSDFGNYSCQASNSLGRERGYLQLSGLPTVCYFDSPTISHYKDQYNVSWTVTSYSAIREYRLFYRKQSALNTLDFHDVPIYNQVVPHILTHHERGINDQWENVVIPEITYDYGVSRYNFASLHHLPQSTRHTKSFLIKNLQPATHYEVRVQARNDHGWNKLSAIFHFTTRSDDYENAIHPDVLDGAGLIHSSVLNGATPLSSSLIFAVTITACAIISSYFSRST
ncbi:lachesin-like [Culicoides brevitarsis]|uniref:lachesin-like n=1 Tax=Culicoides brevitarsis TaxID=469753 RepID=UPI00307BC6BE